MSYDLPVLKQYLNETREAASAVLGMEHIGHDANKVIKDLLAIADSFDSLMQQSQGQSADSRIIKKKYDHARADIRALEAKLEAIKASIFIVVESIKTVTVEASAITKRHEADLTHADAASAATIKQATQRMAEIVIQISKGQ